MASRPEGEVIVQARPLEGLPAYGEPALSFPRPDAFSEGFVVEFVATAGERWIGNFASGPAGGAQSIHVEFGPRDVIVFSGGAGYVIDIESRCLVADLGFGFDWLEFVEELGILVACNDLWFEAFVGRKRKWRTRRVSWDEIRNIRRAGTKVTAEAYHLDGDWYPLVLDVVTGEVVGGSYDAPDASDF